MNLRSLRVFAAVMEEGTLARAAARLNMSESAASRQLQLLEESVGRSLFRRDRKRLDPTPEAEVLLPEVLRVLSQLDGMRSLVDTARTTSPPLRIVCHSRVLYGLVLPAVSLLAREAPEVPVRLDVQPRRDLGRRMMQGLFDLGVSALPAPSEGLLPEVIGSAPLGVLVAAHHPLAGRASVATRELRGLAYIALDGSTVIRQLVDAALAGTGERLPAAFEVSTGASAYRLVRDGLGFTFADQISVDPAVAQGTALVPWTSAIMVTYGSFRSPASRHHAVPRLEELLRSVFQGALDAGGARGAPSPGD